MHGAGRDTEEGMGERNVRQMRGGRRPSHGRDNLAAEHSVLVGQNRVSGTFTSGMDMDAHETGSGSVGRFEKGSVERCVPIYALRRSHIARRCTGGSATTTLRAHGRACLMFKVERSAACHTGSHLSYPGPIPRLLRTRIIPTSVVQRHVRHEPDGERAPVPVTLVRVHRGGREQRRAQPYKVLAHGRLLRLAMGSGRAPVAGSSLAR
jgi:hypothetical protein